MLLHDRFSAAYTVVIPSWAGGQEFEYHCQRAFITICYYFHCSPDMFTTSQFNCMQITMSKLIDNGYATLIIVTYYEKRAIVSIIWNMTNFYHNNVQLAFYKCSSEYTCISIWTPINIEWIHLAMYTVHSAPISYNKLHTTNTKSQMVPFLTAAHNFISLLFYNMYMHAVNACTSELVLSH